VLAVGIVLIPCPGPGWLVVFAGLAILATEFVWAGRVLAYASARYDQWTTWLRRQPLPLRLFVIMVTGLVVLATLWLLNVFTLVGGWFGIREPWLTTPFSHLAG
jgi:uncharacterized protein (TIGR02611 family)